MTMDDECSIYVGGIPYDTTEDTVRTVFNLYGAILDVKVFLLLLLLLHNFTCFMYSILWLKFFFCVNILWIKLN